MIVLVSVCLFSGLVAACCAYLSISASSRYVLWTPIVIAVLLLTAVAVLLTQQDTETPAMTRPAIFMTMAGMAAFYLGVAALGGTLFAKMVPQKKAIFLNASVFFAVPLFVLFIAR